MWVGPTCSGLPPIRIFLWVSPGWLSCGTFSIAPERNWMSRIVCPPRPMIRPTWRLRTNSSRSFDRPGVGVLAVSEGLATVVRGGTTATATTASNGVAARSVESATAVSLPGRAGPGALGPSTFGGEFILWTITAASSLGLGALRTGGRDKEKADRGIGEYGTVLSERSAVADCFGESKDEAHRSSGKSLCGRWGVTVPRRNPGKPVSGCGRHPAVTCAVHNNEPPKPTPSAYWGARSAQLPHPPSWHGHLQRRSTRCAPPRRTSNRWSGSTLPR